MLENNYSRLLDKFLESCECDLAVPREWATCLAERGIIQPIAQDRRRFVRHWFTGRAVLEYETTFPSIQRKHTVAQVVTRDLSRSGITFLHADQLYPGERITLWLPIGKQTFIVERCLEHNEKCFEIGASIDESQSNSLTPADILTCIRSEHR